MLQNLRKEDIEALRGVARWLNENTGIYYGENKLDTLKNKLFKVCLHSRLTLSEIFNQLQNGNGNKSAIALQVAAAASTNHTAFFRENIWDYFKGEILRDLLSRCPQVRIWSAAASSGEEAYTIAIVASELLGLDNLKGRVAMLGTDISFRILKQAEEAIYPEERIKSLSPAIRQKYFKSLGDGSVRVHDTLRSICLFRRLNLKKRPYPFKKCFHIIFCRNVLYYFTHDERERIVNALFDFAEPGGWLIVSVTESLSCMKTPWKKIPGKTCIYKKG